MKTPTLLLAALCAGSLLAGAPETRAREAYRFDAPAKEWAAALPIGNGRLGALLFGDPNAETIVVNETSVWAPPEPWPINRQGAPVVKQVRELLFAGKRAEANALAQRALLRPNPRLVAAYQPLCILRLDFAPAGTPFSDYARGVRLDEGVAWAAYRQGGVAFRREALAAYDDDILAVSLAVDKPGALTFTLAPTRPGETLRAEPDGPGRLRLTGATGPGGVRFEALLEIRAQGGAVAATPDGKLRVEGADAAEIRLAAATDYNKKDPTQPLRADLRAQCAAALGAVAGKPFAALRADHAKAFAARYGRVALDIPCAATGESLEARVARVREERRLDTESLLLLHDFCRYLLIASSRPGGLPANLQGIWNPLMDPPWDSDWHLDVNLSMHYWPAGVWNLPELAEPLTTLAEMALPRSAETARDMLGAEGWFLSVCTDAWGFPVPFGHVSWGLYVAGGAWLLQDALAPWRHTRDPALRDRLLPLLRQQTRFFLSWLVEDPRTGRLVSGPSTSPENAYRLPDGSSASVDMGPAHDQELIHATLTDFLALARAQTPADPLIPRAQAALERLALPQVGPDGALQEWSEPLPEAEPGHRHISHAYGLLPGRRVTLDGTPELCAALDKTLRKRFTHGYHVTGWSLGVAAGIRARLRQGDAALEAIDQAALHFCPNLFTLTVGYPQVSDMNGAPAALCELLLRTEGDVVHVLPALPRRLAAAGAFRGFRAEPGLLVDAAWEGGRLTALTVTALRDGAFRLRLPDRALTLTLRRGERRAVAPAGGGEGAAASI